MELLSPAGNVEKLAYAYQYGADAAYIGLRQFSLRVKADNFYADEYEQVAALKRQFPGRRLHCALNIAFHNRDIDAFLGQLDYFKQYPIDAFIVQDLGIVPILQKHFPHAQLHVSTQASVTNREAVKMYRSMGFSRVVLAREVSLAEVREIKDAVPDMEIECFAHGAMCIAYSGRCLMSAYLTGRSAQSGFCSHTCRWEYDVLADAKKLAESGALVLRERKRPDALFPVYEGDGFTAVLSSKDLRMIEHLDDMRRAGVDSLKIEGRMKSVYYVAMVTRAYRKALDALAGTITAEEAAPFIASLDEVAHRESTTGFFYGRAEADKTTVGASDSPYVLAGTVCAAYDAAQTEAVFAAGAEMIAARERERAAMHPQARAAAERDEAAHPEKCPAALQKRAGWHLYPYVSLNKTDAGTELEIITPDVLKTVLAAEHYVFANPKNGAILSFVNPDHDCALYTDLLIPAGALVRTKDAEYERGVVRTTGR
ncbi:MAG: U32 family peptidase [Treponema sp.]|nr:U32 family peptidase [Treponema sp.]